MTGRTSSSSPTGIVLRVLGGVLLGVALAAVAQFLFFVGDAAWLNLFVWALVGIVLGAVSRRWSIAIGVDAAVGFALVFAYSVMGYQASAPLSGALAPFALVALLGAVGMAAAGAAGYAVRRLVSRPGRAS